MGATTGKKKEPASLRRSGQAEGGRYIKSKIARDGPRPLHRGKRARLPSQIRASRRRARKREADPSAALGMTVQERSRSLTHQKAMEFGMTAKRRWNETRQHIGEAIVELTKQ